MPRPKRRPLSRRFYRRDSRTLAPELLNKLLVRGERVGRIVEVEAYAGEEDPGSHAFRGRTARNATMFGPPGRLYVYRSYGVHWCANVVCGEDGWASAVLVRGLTPVGGIEQMFANRPGIARERDLCAGPGRLCQALGIDQSFDGTDLVSGSDGVFICDDGVEPPNEPCISTRVGLSSGRGDTFPWRFCVPGAVGLSRPCRL
jgi:DNA-3-methyladenine glycosylase